MFFERVIEVFQRMEDDTSLQFRTHPQLSMKIDPDEPCSVKGFFLPFGEKPFITTLTEAVACALDITKSISVLIQLGIIHHDISLDNIMKTASGVYFLVDFDDAYCTVDGRCPACHPDRLSPDKHCAFTYEEHGHEVDIWAIGRLLITFNIPDKSRELFMVGSTIEKNCKTLTTTEVTDMIQQLLL
jgi:serine/threonine protein kinase